MGGSGAIAAQGVAGDRMKVSGSEGKMCLMKGRLYLLNAKSRRLIVGFTKPSYVAASGKKHAVVRRQLVVGMKSCLDTKV